MFKALYKHFDFQGNGVWKCGFDKAFLNDENKNRFVPMGEYVLEEGRPLDGVYFLRTNGQRPWSYASYGELNS